MLFRLPALRLQYFLAVCLLLLSTVAFSQNRTITGKVTSAENNTPIVGATITVTGTDVATQTDSEGNFSILVPPGRNSLTISYVGFPTQNVALGASNVVSINMSGAAASLN